MNKQIKEIWCQELRSGSWRQGTDALKNDDNSYCCLGVLCETLHRKPELGFEVNLLEGAYEYKNDFNDSNLPTQLSEDLDIPPEIEDQLTVLKDSDGLDFEQIADYIEESL